MSDANGRSENGFEIATLEMLRIANTKRVVATQASARLGKQVVVLVKSIRKARYLAMLPPRPPEADAWPTDSEEYGKHYGEWMKSLSHEERMARMSADDAVTFKVLAEGLIQPAYSEELSDLLATDADDIAIEILRFSEILKPAPAPTG